MKIDFGELLSRLPTVSVLVFLNTEHTIKGNYVYVDCPDCQGKGKLSICTRGDKQNLCYCLAEKKGQNILQYASKTLGKPIRETAEIIVGEVLKIKTMNDNKPLDVSLTLEWHDSMKTYCHPDLAKEMEIGLPKGKTIMAGHISFCVHDADGQKIAYIGKNVKNGEWKFPKSFDPSTVLYNFHRIDGPEIMVTREIETAVRCFGFGLPAVSTFGANLLTGNQVELLRRFERITVLKQDEEFLENITYQGLCSIGNYWRLKTIPFSEEQFKELV